MLYKQHKFVLFQLLAYVISMLNSSHLTFADQIGQYFAHNSSIPPMAGRLLGYLIVCDPGQQSINELAEALKASRSAVVGAVQVLENRGVITRIRQAGSRNYLIGFDAEGYESRGFDGTAYLRLADLLKLGLELSEGATTSRRTQLEELIRFSEFLAKRMPLLQEEYYQHVGQKSY